MKKKYFFENERTCLCKRTNLSSRIDVFNVSLSFYFESETGMGPSSHSCCAAFPLKERSPEVRWPFSRASEK